jgi:hypothetical protein
MFQAVSLRREPRLLSCPKRPPRLKPKRSRNPNSSKSMLWLRVRNMLRLMRRNKLNLFRPKEKLS